MVKKTNNLHDKLIPKGRSLYFNEEHHIYKDEYDNKYTSVTTLIGKYYNQFDKKGIAGACERIGKTPNHPNYLKYKGKTAKQILYEWQTETDRACAEGTAKHNYLEDIIKSSSNYKPNRSKGDYIKLYTLDDIIAKHSFGKINTSHKKILDLANKYPDIYGVIKALVDKGYNIYSEVAVYDGNKLISGLIDILAIKGDQFVIVDWKTNKAPIRFESGFYLKDDNGNLTDEFKLKNEFCKYPLERLADSVGNHYALQLSLYAYLVESFGLKFGGLCLVHIRTIGSTINTKGETVTNEKVTLQDMPYLKSEIEALLLHHAQTTNNVPTLF